MIREIFPIPAFRDNYIWTIVSDDGRCCVVDPGDAAPVIEYVQNQQLTLSDILVTHHHPDHTGGLPALIEKYSPAVYGPNGSRITGINTFVEERGQVEVFNYQFSVLEVPGHTLDHVAYHCADAKPPILFCGDTLFAAGCGRLFEGSPAQMVNSLKKLAELAPTTRVYCTHEYTLANLRFAQAAEPDNSVLSNRVSEETQKRDKGMPTLPSTIALELATNPFLRFGEPKLAGAAATRLGRRPSDAVEVFATLRSWKDNF